MPTIFAICPRCETEDCEYIQAEPDVGIMSSSFYCTKCEEPFGGDIDDD